MQSPTIIVLVLTALLTVAALITLLWSVVRRTSAVIRDITDLQERLMPQLEQLQRDADIASRELEQVGASLDELARSRADRRDPGARPAP